MNPAPCSDVQEYPHSMLDGLCSLFKKLFCFIPYCFLLTPSSQVEDNVMHFHADFSVMLDALAAKGFTSSNNCICTASG